MKKSVNIILFLAVVFSVFIACQKEYSYETGNGLGGTAGGSLQDSLGNCQGGVVYGTYKVDTLLTDSNYVKVKATISSPGKYKVYTDTVNGCWFMDSAYIISTNTQTFKMKGFGKPILPLASTFTVHFNNSICQFTINMAATATSSDYFPTTVGSNWTYYDNYATALDSVVSTNYNATVTGSSNIYRLFADSFGDTSLYRKDGVGNYYQYAQLVDSSNPVEYIFLKDNVAKNTGWDSPETPAYLNGVLTTAKYHFTITAKDTSLFVSGYATKIDSVIIVKEDIMYKISGTYQTAISGYASYAKKVGWIDYEYPTLSPPYSFTIRRWQVF